MAGSTVKTAVKRALSTPEIQNEMDDRQVPTLQNKTLQQHRLAILQHELEGAIPTLTYSTQNVNSFLTMC